MLKLYDNSKLSTYKLCPRKYYYTHVKHIKPDTKAMPLVFGSCWGTAMDAFYFVLLDQQGSPKDAVKAAYEAFIKDWVEEYELPSVLSTDEVVKYGARTPMVAAEMIINYAEERTAWLSNFTLTAIEHPFVVPIGMENVYYCGKMDKCLQHKDTKKDLVLDHKTSTSFAKKGGFQPSFSRAFDINSQVTGYNHASNYLFERPGGVRIDAALVHKTHHNIFKLLTLGRNIPDLDNWLADTRYWITRVIESEKQDFWPKNTESCEWKYGSCVYAQDCKLRGPCQEVPDIPAGYKIDPWEPLSDDEFLVAKERLSA